jgi:hypothetical protein
MRSHHVFSIAISLLLLTSCGGSSPDQAAAPNPGGEIQQALRAASQQHQIPYRLLLAVGLKESGLSPYASDTTYVNEELTLGLKIGETAFGLSREALGLATDTPPDLISQVNAYAAWVDQQLQQRNLNLPSTLARPDQIYDWVWQLALMHREGSDNRKNVQILFARELIAILNEGATWQNPASGEIIQLAPRPQPLSIVDFSPTIQKNLQLDTEKSEIFSVDYMQLTYEQITGPQNLAESIRVIHCPFSLSGCLELQNQTKATDEASLQAHYVIPPTDQLLSNPIKIRQHRSPVVVTNTRGQPESIQDAIVIMLVGSSGRYVDGRRLQANPNWYSNEQLKSLGKIVRGICELMKLDYEQLDLEKCQTPGVPGGVQFQNQGRSAQYHWGDVPDYDENIFWTYLNNPDELGGQVEFQFPAGSGIYQAGQPIQFNLSFITGVAKITVEYMERCSNDKLIWTTLETRFIRNVATQPFHLTLYDSGPNGSGQHFFRALVFDEENELKGWSISGLHLTNYEEDSQPAANLKACERLGT